MYLQYFVKIFEHFVFFRAHFWELLKQQYFTISQWFYWRIYLLYKIGTCLNSSNIVFVLTLPRWWALSWRGRRSWRGWSTWPGSQSIGSPTRRWRYHAAETGSVIEYKVYNYLLTSITCPFKKTDAWSVNSNKIKGGKTTALRIRNQSEPIAHIKTFKLKVSLVIYLKRVMRNFLNFSFKLSF